MQQQFGDMAAAEPGTGVVGMGYLGQIGAGED